MTAAATWLLGLMLWLSPPDDVTRLSLASEHHETTPERVARYALLAEAVDRVTRTEPPVFPGPDGAARTAALLVAVTFHESDGWHWSIDTGARRGDGGTSWCVGQIHLPGRTTTPEGWVGKDLVEDRDKCLRSALRVVRASMTMCRRHPVEERLAAYVSGSCDVALATSRRRWRTFQRALRYAPPPAREVEAAHLRL